MAAALVAAACSTASDDGRRSDQERLLQSVLEQGSDDANSLAFDRDAAACAAARLVAGLGPDRLRALGLDVPSRRGPELTEPPLTEEEGDLVYAAFDDCLDLEAQLTGAFAQDGGLPDDVAACVAARYVASGVLRDALMAPGFDATLDARIDDEVGRGIEACSAEA